MTTFQPGRRVGSTLARGSCLLTVSAIALAAGALVAPASAQVAGSPPSGAPVATPTDPAAPIQSTDANRPNATNDAVAGAAGGQAAPNAGDAGDIIVTGSRITSGGFSAPTPTTVIGADQLAKAAQPNIFNAIAQLPSLMGSTGRATSVATTSSGVQGLSSFSLRGLGAIRTLTLLDGQRFVGANVTGVPDISQFPQLLISRVDVVNGGASASYGSDAVGGVVNFITQKKFTGFKANVEGGITTYGDDKSITGQFAWGQAFMDDRLHVEISGEYSHEGGVPNPGFGLTGANGRHWYVSPALQVKAIAATPAGQPQITYITNAQQFQYSKYGLITSGPLQGTAFGPNGTPYQFQYGSNGVPTGTGAVTNCVSPFCSGGDLSGLVGAGTSLASRLSRAVGYGRVGFDLTPDIEVYGTLNLAQVTSSNSPNPGAAKQANLTIQCNPNNANVNPFVPASIQAQCARLGINSFQYGVANAIFPDFIHVHTRRRNYRGVIGTTGKFDALGTNWSFDAYYEHGENITDINVRSISLNARYNAAIQAVNGPNGTIICAANANGANGAPGCVPLNIIGNVTPNQAALDYVIPRVGPYQHTRNTQDAASLAFNGQPLSLWAGPISVAFGYEYRREAYHVMGDAYGAGTVPNAGIAGTPYSADYPADPVISTSGANWYAGNYRNGNGKFNVNEGFIEFNIPLLDSQTLGKANINIAGRETKYSTLSGFKPTWKIGGTYETPIQGLRFRAVTSRDVRAPNLSELFAAPTVTNGIINVPARDSQGNPIVLSTAGQPIATAVGVIQSNIGNPNLRPEVARNTEVGASLSRPSFLPGFSASFDYYTIKVKGVVTQLSGQQQADLCYVVGNQSICPSIFIDKLATGGVSPNGSTVSVQAFNVASIKTRGFDIEASYQLKLDGLGLPGTFTTRALATHVITYKQDSGIPGTIPTELAGVNTGSIPHWKYYVTESYDNDRVSLSLTERWFSAGVYNNEYIECNGNCPVPTAQHPTIDNNHMAGAFYFDVGGSYRIFKGVTAYFKVDNVFNKTPVPSPATNVGYGANPFLYDVLGRTYRGGLRYNF